MKLQRILGPLFILFFAHIGWYAQAQQNEPLRKWNNLYANFGGYNATAGFNFETEIFRRQFRNVYLLTGVGFAERQQSDWYKFSSFVVGLNYVSSGLIAFEGGLSVMPYFFDSVRSTIPNEKNSGAFGVINMGLRIRPRFSNGFMLRVSWNPLLGQEGIYLDHFGFGFGYSFNTRLRT